MTNVDGELDELEGKQLPPLTLSVVAVLAGAMILSLMGFQLALQLPGGQGIEDMLGWTDPDSVAAALDHWRGLSTLPLGSPPPDRWHVEAAYLLVDTALFMPLYAVLLLMCAHALHSELQRDDKKRRFSALGNWMKEGFLPAAIVVVFLLVAVDVVENYGGIYRVGVSRWVYFGCLLAAAVVAFSLASWVAATSKLGKHRRVARSVFLGAVVVGALLVGYAFFGSLQAGGCTSPKLIDECGGLSAKAHNIKPCAVLLAVGVVAGGWLLWLFGADLQRPTSPPQSGTAYERAYRAALRSGMGAIVWRTRYVLVVLTVYVVLTLGLDQCRDVLLALGRWSPSAADTVKPVAQGYLRAIMVVMVGLSVMLLVHSTWLWARLACRVKRQRDVGQSVPGNVHVPLGMFARIWARALSLVPLICVYGLVAFAISDAANAAAAISDDGSFPTDLTYTVLMLCLIGALAVGLSALFLMYRRVFSLDKDADYYNQADDVHQLLSGADEGTPPSGNAAWSKRALKLHDALSWLSPRTLPLVALVGIVLLRFLIAWEPGPMSAIPPAIALVTLTLTWWMAVGGALTLVEVRHGRPYGLFVIVVIGVLGMLPLGMADNHVLPITMPLAGKAALAAQRMHGVMLVAWFAFIAGGLWWVLTAAPDQGRGWFLRGVSVLVGLFLAVLALRWADRAELPDLGENDLAGRPVPARVLTLDKAVKNWLAQLPSVPANADDPAQRVDVFLVASEGGGIRSAYWTAQVLLALRQKYPEFDRRTFAMSGVSGGAMGIAAYSACLRAVGHPSGPKTMEKCVGQGFAAIDPLSPLLAAWLFEDVFAHILPVPMARDGAKGWLRCSRPACGYLSRAQGFEREWMRALPALAQPLSAVGGGESWEPHLFLNSTWVESGELAPAASLVVDTDVFPAARDVQARLGRELSLIGGAHVAARFPFINPLAAVQPASDAASATARGVAPGDLPAEGLDGHLGDGGYFDNSAAVSLTPVWRRVQSALLEQYPARRLVVVMIRNGQNPLGCERVDTNGPKRHCILPKRDSLSAPADLARPTRRRNWSLYANVLGPIVSVLNVSGIGAHGRYAPAALRAEAASREISATDAGSATEVMLIDQLDKGALVPLGWYLSPTARDALEAQAGCLGYELDGKPEDAPAYCH